MIKLQLLLRDPARDRSDDPALCALLEAHGMHVTACGLATISAETSPAEAENLFGPIPNVRAGFASDVTSTPALAIPADLQHAVSLITIAPRHATPGQPT
ncbi:MULTISPECIES: hypothetical protein [Massilia]|uniref:Uncharacterized protein n=2 Tax=Massilia TaxID=149698 RepID=A0ABY3ZZG0_9BURK|nr:MULTISPECIES: hypothetical protein [Massilia]NHZ39720.1 hypothetical protein [Massilia aquatica]UOD27249.1 hypothetical protein INH39_17070 [Massilia violaceinigra]